MAPTTPFPRLPSTWHSVLEHRGWGANGNGVIYSVSEDGRFEVLHTLSATDPTTGANYDGANADNGVVLDGNRVIGIAIYGGAGSPAGYNNSGGTLYELTLGVVRH